MTNNNNLQDSKEYSLKKHKVISEMLDRIVDDLVIMFEELQHFKMSNTDKALFRNKSKSVLYYWLSQVYDEAHSDIKNLESALDTSKQITRKLRESEQNLKAIIASSSASAPRPDSSNIVTKHDTVRTPTVTTEKLEEKIDGFYNSITDRVIQELNKNNPKK